MCNRTARSWFTRTGAVAGALLALTIVGAPLQAQQTLAPMRIESNGAASDNARADTLDARARSMYSQSRRYLDAARLHRRAAQLRGDDPRAVDSFRSAAWLYSAAGKQQIARRMMENAAERATVVGDVEKAANAYVDAAYLAIASSREDQVAGILARMHAVLNSPLLTADRRSAILDRVGSAPAIARLDSARRPRP